VKRWIPGRRYDFHGREIAWDVCGSGSPAVVVHGTPWSSFNLRHVIRALADAGFEVHYFDLVGYGWSSKAPGDVSLGVQNRVLRELLDHWELEAPVAVGHDFGGATVLRTHLLDGRDFARLVLIDPVAVSPWGSPFFRHVREHEAAFAGVPGYVHEAIVRAYVQTAAHLPLDDDILDAIVRPWRGADGQAAFYRQIAQADACYTDEVQPLYRRIERPVRILWGREDTWIPLSQGEALASLVAGAELETIAGAGHLVIEEKPAELAERILRFLHGTA
jgi:pimeloyl-ACP methyl ester carboxylesterase